jgi:spore germination cell wall hydrolase CwlJ-like protein
MAYIFGGNTGIRTPQEAARLRAVAEAMASRGRAPSNIGEGLAAIGDAIASRRYRMRADRMESEGRASYQSKYGDLLKSYFTPGGANAPSGSVQPAEPIAPQQDDDLTQAPPEYPMGGGGMPSPENAANTQLPPAEDMAAMVRTVIGEAGNQSPEGQRAVAEVILNRARATGMTPMQVVMAKGQFEPWQTRAAELNAIDPNSQQYQSVLANIKPAFGPDDPTGGADHFYAPEAQAALGRDTPDWAQGQTGRDIGDHRFYSLGYGGEPGATGPQGAATEQAAGQPGIQQVADSGGIDPQRIIDALSDPWLPDGQKAVLQAVLEQRMQEMAPVEYGITQQGGDFYRTNPRTGQVEKTLDNPPEPKPYTFTTEGGKIFKMDPNTGKVEEAYDASAGAAADAPKITAITALRKDYENQPGTSRYRQSVPVLQSMAAAVDDTTAMADLDFVYGMAQIFDPESVVRESEMGMVIDSQSMPAAIKGRLEKILNGEAALGPQARRDLVEASRRRVQQYRTQAEGEAKQFSGIAERNRITPEDIMRPLEDMPELRPAAEALPEGVDEEDIQETMRAHGLTREQVLERLNARP